MRARLLCDLDAAQHAGDLFITLRARERRDGGRGGLALRLLTHLQMVMGEGGGLRQVSDAQHLMRRAPRAQLFADDLRSAAADAVFVLVVFLCWLALVVVGFVLFFLV